MITEQLAVEPFQIIVVVVQAFLVEGIVGGVFFGSLNFQRFCFGSSYFCRFGLCSCDFDRFGFACSYFQRFRLGSFNFSSNCIFFQLLFFFCLHGSFLFLESFC